VRKAATYLNFLEPSGPITGLLYLYLFPLRAYSSFLRLLPCLPVTLILPFISPSIKCCRKQFIHKIWPIQLAITFFTVLKRVIEGKIKRGIEVTGRRGRRRRKLLDDLKERRGYSHLKEEALDRTVWRACFGRGFGPVLRRTSKWMNECRIFFSSLTLCNAQDLIY